MSEYYWLISEFYYNEKDTSIYSEIAGLGSLLLYYIWYNLNKLAVEAIDSYLLIKENSSLSLNLSISDFSSEINFLSFANLDKYS